MCVIDHNPLESCDPKPPSDSVEPAAESDDPEGSSKGESPDKYQSLGRFVPGYADHLLQKFLEAGVRFQIDRIPRRVLTMGGFRSGAGYIARDQIEIFVHSDDDEKAVEIKKTVDWEGNSIA